MKRVSAAFLRGLLSILLTVAALGPLTQAEARLFGETCKHAFAPNDLPIYPLPENSRMMVTSEQRASLLKKMWGPIKLKRKWILSKYDKDSRDALVTQRVRNIRAYLASQTGWDGYRKAIVWEAFVEDMNAEDPKSRSFYSSYHEGTDGSFVFLANGPFALVITREGELYGGRIERQLEPREPWAADYSRLKKY